MSDRKEDPMPETKEDPMPETKINKKGFKIETINDLKRMSMIAQGIDPDSQQTMNDFIDLKNKIERSNFPNIPTVLCVAQLTGYSQLYYPSEDDPFNMVADVLSAAYMAKGGWKSDQFVEMTKQTPSLSDLQAVSERNPSLTDRIFRRGKEE